MYSSFWRFSLLKNQAQQYAGIPDGLRREFYSHVMSTFTRRTLAQRLPFYYGWVILTTAGSSMFVRNAAASLTLAVFVYPISQELGLSRGLIAGAAGLGGLLPQWRRLRWDGCATDTVFVWC